MVSPGLTIGGKRRRADIKTQKTATKASTPIHFLFVMLVTPFGFPSRIRDVAHPWLLVELVQRKNREDHRAHPQDDG